MVRSRRLRDAAPTVLALSYVAVLRVLILLLRTELVTLSAPAVFLLWGVKEEVYEADEGPPPSRVLFREGR